MDINELWGRNIGMERKRRDREDIRKIFEMGYGDEKKYAGLYDKGKDAKKSVKRKGRSKSMEI